MSVYGRDPARARGEGVYTGAGRATQKAYDTYFAERNVLVQAAASQGLIQSGSIVVNDEILSRAEFENSEYYQDFLRVRDVHTIIGGPTYQTESCSGLISFQRPRAAGPVMEDEVGNLRLLLCWRLHDRFTPLWPARLPDPRHAARAPGSAAQPPLGGSSPSLSATRSNPSGGSTESSRGTTG